LGELITIGDNTGFSTGPHTHLGLYRLDANKNKIDQNEATGSYNPAGFFTGVSAVDASSYPTLMKSVMRYYSYRLGLYG
jgi:murein DD-endopeptidase MepM/ murein hydrolase activator NlpD